ncbi:MAG: zinc-binding dehydrogenase [Frankia sp.]
MLADGRGSVRLGKADEPVPAPGEVVIEVAAYSVNRGETFLLERPPSGWRPGKDVAGRVVAAALDGSGPVVGAHVVGHPPAGGWAERVAVLTTSLVVLPEGVRSETAAALPLAGLTALRLLRRVGNLLGRRLLVTGASGGVGHYVTELAVAAGAEVVAVSTTPERAARLREFGAQTVTDVASAEGRFDVVMESVGGESFVAARRKASSDGVMMWFGQASRQPVTLDFFDWVDGTVQAPIVQFDYTRGDRPYAADLATLVDLVARGRLHPEIGTVLPWEHTARVIDDIRGRRLRGNAVLTLT